MLDMESVKAERDHLEAEVLSLREHLARQGSELRLVVEERDRLAQEAERLRQAYASLTQARDMLEQQLASHFHLRVSNAEAALERSAKQAERTEKELSALRNQLRQSEDAALKLGREVASLRGSASWRVTAPARAVLTFLKGRRAKR